MQDNDYYRSGEYIRITADNPIDYIWARLSMWESPVLAKKLLEDRAALLKQTLDPIKAKAKAGALTYCLRNAREYFFLKSTSPTTNVISNYYGCLWLISAIAAADPLTDVDLEKLEQSTHHGHGLKCVFDDTRTFPSNDYVYIRKQGALYQLMNWNKVIEESVVDSISLKYYETYLEVPEDKKELLIPLMDLFARIPELKDTFEYITADRALCIVVHDDGERNARETPEDSLQLSARDYLWVRIKAKTDAELAYLIEHGFPFEDTIRNGEYVSGKVPNAKAKHWAKQSGGPLGAYRSPISYDWYWQSPLLGCISDPLIIHFILLYHLSILARYRPAVWREIIEGEYSQYRTLIDLYNHVVAKVIPHLTLQSVSGKPVVAVTPALFH